MRRLTSNLFPCLLVLGLMLGESAQAAPCSRVKSDPDRWVSSKVNALILAARRAFESEDDFPAYERVLDGITSTMQTCKLDDDEKFVSRYRQFVDYVAVVSLDRSADHELGFSVPDKQYFAETSQYVKIPDFLLDQDFLSAVSRFETLERAKAFLRRINLTRDPAEQLIFFSYKSRHLGTPDNDDSFRRLLILVPGNYAQGVPERWVQFGVTDPGARQRVRNVSVVATMPSGEGTAKVYFKDFYRTFRRDGLIKIKGRWELGFGDDNCVSCHKSGVLPIFPVKGSVSPNELVSVLKVNERFRTYGSPRFGKYLDTSKLGPGLSSASWDDRQQRYGSHFGTSSVDKAMACAACHQPERLGALNWPMDKTLISSYVKGGQMPFGYKLQAAARSELYTKLIQEYFDIDDAHPGILKSWLLGRTQ
ncbi:MAG: hypothetical protein ABI967_09425 [bacterium]